jgi:hypothetical protein
MVQPKRSQQPGAGKQSDDDRRIWQFFTVDQRWICPYCRGAHKVQQNTAQSIRALMQQHLQRQCTNYAGGQGRMHTITEMQHQAHLYNVEYFARNDRAWQVFDHEGYWFSPCSLQRVPSVQLNNRRFDANTVQRMAEHLLACPYYRQNTIHPIEVVQQARDLHAKVMSLSRNLQKVVDQKIWQYADNRQQWVCPYCLDHNPEVTVPAQGDWLQLTPLMAHHLLSRCPVYQANPRGIRSEREVAAVAKGQGPSHAFGGRSPSNPSLQVMPIGPAEKTPLQTMSLSPVTQRLHTPPSGSRPIAPDPSQLTPHTRPSPILPPIGQAPPNLPPLSMPPPDQPGTGPFGPPTGNHTPLGTPTGGSRQITTGFEQAPQARVVKQGQTDRHSTTDGVPPSAPIARPATRSPSQESIAQPQVAKPLRQHSANIQIGADDLEQGLGWMDEAGSKKKKKTVPEAIDHEPGTSDDLSWMDDMEEEIGTSISPTSNQEQNTERLRARDVQQNMLKGCPEIEGFHFATRYEAAADVSGDFYEFIALPDGRIGFAMGDVSGHGMGAGLIMSMAKKVFSIYARMGESPQRVLAQMNDALVEDLGGKRFVSLTYAILDPDARTITWVRAGHNPTLTVNLNTGAFREIKPPGMVVGMKGGAIFANSLKTETTLLQSGDVFLVYTDGITETLNRQGDEYGPERLEQLLTDHADKDINHLLDRIMDSARQFRGGGVTDDDITLLGLSVD